MWSACRRNTAGYVAAGRVVVYPKGVWDKDDVLPLNVQPSNSASYSVALRYKGAQPGPAVELTTIDEMVRELGLERVDYIKMDIEGAEREALAGAAGTIRRFKPRLTISLEHRYDDPTAIPAIVRSILSEYRMAPRPLHRDQRRPPPRGDELLRGEVAVIPAPRAWSASGPRAGKAYRARPARGRLRG